MTLVDLLFELETLTDDKAKQYALVFGEEVYLALCETQKKFVHTKHKVSPVQLSDGKWALCADLLLEIEQGGLYHEGFASLPVNLFDKVEVNLWKDIVKLLPIE